MKLINIARISNIITVPVSILTLIMLTTVTNNFTVKESFVVSLLFIYLNILIEIYLRSSIQTEEIVNNIKFVNKLPKNINFVNYIERVIDNTCKIESKYNENKMLNDAYENLTRTYVNSLINLENGRISLDESLRISHMTSLLGESKEKDVIITTSFVNLNEWWYKNNGKKYFNENIEAIKRGAKIIRIFILKKESESEVIEFAKKHHDAGIEVFFVNETEITSTEMKQNFFLYNKRIISYAQSIGSSAHYEGIISFNNDDILKYTHISEDLRKLSVPYSKYLLSENMAVV